ncbi:hypothetical protein JOC36_000231 [Weissella uvarum]|uniref:hypothetical protein n=1 Tax=Weissella uvarum TaxID=1479233 RepID=UPI001961B24D|nr:hypothetical protein [Weissella uvarum]MBM7616698.1 hypothetical protein [Weissella uvarum]MCM0594847.1 hypothetical protein [Weissella uvarum]
MIYLTQGVKQLQYTQSSGNEWQHLVQSVMHPRVISKIQDEIDTFKKDEAPYVIYGTSTCLDRGTSEITGRIILFIDVDDNGKDYDKEAYHIDAVLSSLNIKHVIYPTINNSIKPGERLRVGIPLDNELAPEEYSKVWQVLTYHLHLNADYSGATRAFKQLQGIYVKTTQNAQNEPIIENNGTALNTAFFLSKYEKLNMESSKQNLPKPAMNSNAPKWAMNNRKIIRALLAPEEHYNAFGGWDNMLTSIGGWVFKNTKGDINLTADVVQDTNNRGTAPISEQELTKKFKSWMQHWHY